MENAVESLMISFAVVVFVIALSLTTYLLSNAMTTTENLVYRTDKTNYYDNLVLGKNAVSNRREVSLDTVINSLYRYYKENFIVKLYNNSNQLIQIFDTETEGVVFTANSKIPDRRTNKEIAYLNTYNDAGGHCNLHGAPWMGNINEYAKHRVDLYVAGQSGYINNQKVDYSDSRYNLTPFREAPIHNQHISETFIEYMYDGEYYESEQSGEQLAGSTQEKNKIIVEYRVENN